MYLPTDSLPKYWLNVAGSETGKGVWVGNIKVHHTFGHLQSQPCEQVVTTQYNKLVSLRQEMQLRPSSEYGIELEFSENKEWCHCEKIERRAKGKHLSNVR